MSARFAAIVGAVAVGVAAVLLFARLGHYPFWGDEADTVIFARGVWETGDTSAWYGDNLYAYRGGALLDGFHNRATPPAPYYLTAPFWGLFGANRFALRLPFALCGLAAFAVALRWAYVRGAGRITFCLLAVAMALNVSFLLYARQCRYYGLGMLLTMVIGYGYDRYDGRRRRLVALSIALGLLAATHYLVFAAVAVALVVDYVVRGRSRPKLSAVDWAALVVPAVLIVVPVVVVFNPLGRHEGFEHGGPEGWRGKLTLLWQTVRDLNRCEYGLPIVMAAAPLVAGLRRNSALARLFVACFVAFVVTTLLSPQTPYYDGEADVRYYAELILPCVALTVLTLVAVAGRQAWLAVPTTLLLVGTNILHVPWNQDQWRSTPWEYVHELAAPRRPASGALSEWLDENVAAGSVVGMAPTDWLAPLLVAAPQFRYGWQFDAARRTGPYAELPEFQFVGLAPVDVLIVMGNHGPDEPIVRRFLPALRQQGMNYRLDVTLDVYFDDRTRPELIWHWFREQSYDKSSRAVYLYRLVP